jgi:uncharacterized metal-binding protein YceD (DUF177 family)
MKTPPKSFLSNRVLKTNVGFLLSAPSGSHSDSRLDIPEAVRVDEDLVVNAISGALRMTRSKEGILVQAQLIISVDNECSRCLDTVTQNVQVDVEELFAYPPSGISEFSVGADANLNLAPLLRAEVLIEMSHRILCREDCRGLCSTCGANLNRETCDCAQEDIDPRLAVLKKLLTK